MARRNYLIMLIASLLLLGACRPAEYQKIPIESLDSKLKSRGSIIVRDILKSINHKDGARYLLDKDYMTPLVHGRIMHNTQIYREAYGYIPMTIGKISSFSLFQVLDKGLIKTMRYQLKTDAENLEFVELKIDVNIELGLADYYLYITSKDGLLKRENILPAVAK